MISIRWPDGLFEWLLFPFLWTWVFFCLYLVYCAFDRAWEAKAKIPWLAYALGGPPMVFGYALDWAWNFILGTLLFQQVPWYPGAGHPLKWTFTRRLRFWRDSGGARGRQARWWASHLNPFDPGHV